MNKANSSLIFLELNEVNFEYVRRYCDLGRLPTLTKLIARHGIIETTSEQRYEELEPWIQWVSAHTGLSYAEHRLFRLGDIHRHSIPQVWEVLEQAGRKVGAISPMNAANRCAAPSFFLPDPWTKGKVSGPLLLVKLFDAISQAVNDNAEGRLDTSTLFWLIAGFARFSRVRRCYDYARYVVSAARGKSWSKAIFLDRLLADAYLGLMDRDKPDFSSLFLNAAAHIQHHYMFNSRAYYGAMRNPSWYIRDVDDPVLEVYECYDKIIGEILYRHSDKRIMIGTGLHQDPHENATFYWRLQDHAEFLERHSISFTNVQPRMSRDFLVGFDDPEAAWKAERTLNSFSAQDGSPLFEVENRGDELFVMLVWPHDIGPGFVYRFDGGERRGLRDDVAFVAIKNGQHNGIGYLIDTGRNAGQNEKIPLTRVPNLICEALCLDWDLLRDNFRSSPASHSQVSPQR